MLNGLMQVSEKLAHCTNASLHCEHVQPREAGGETGRVVVLFHPRCQRWSRHFVWSEDCMLIMGRTATGRATVATLHLNRPERLNLRRVLHAVGEHPPRAES